VWRYQAGSPSAIENGLRLDEEVQLRANYIDLRNARSYSVMAEAFKIEYRSCLKVFLNRLKLIPSPLKKSRNKMNEME